MAHFNRNHIRLFLGFAALCLVVEAGPAYAVSEEAYERNALPDRQSAPFHAGGFSFLPSLSVSTEYITNIFAEENDEDNDVVVVVNPRLAVQKNIRDHVLNFETGAAFYRYNENKTEDIENYNAAFFGVLTATSRLKLPFRFSYATDHQLRNRERSDVVAREPVRYQEMRAEVGAEYQPNRIFWNNELRYQGRRFDNAETANGNRLVREDGDFDSYEYETVLGYEMQTGLRPFIGLTLSENDYVRGIFETTDFTGPERDNFSVTALGGVEYRYEDIFSGDIALGYQQQDYDDGSIEDIDSLALSGQARWAFRERALLSLELSREVTEDNIINTGIVETEGTLGLNYELDRDLFWNSFVRLEHDDFDESERKDLLFQGNTGLVYIVNPRLDLEAGYTYNRRNSNTDGFDYDQNIFMVRATGSL